MSHRCQNHTLGRFCITSALKSIHIYACNGHLDNGNQESGSMDQVFCNIIFMAQGKDELEETKKQRDERCGKPDYKPEWLHAMFCLINKKWESINHNSWVRPKKMQARSEGLWLVNRAALEQERTIQGIFSPPQMMQPHHHVLKFWNAGGEDKSN